MSSTDTDQERRLVFSVEAAGELLSLSHSRMFALIKTGEIRSVRVERLRRIPADALAEHVARIVAAQAPEQEV